jgi:ketosteroid isomerase-like protein
MRPTTRLSKTKNHWKTVIAIQTSRPTAIRIRIRTTKKTAATLMSMKVSTLGKTFTMVKTTLLLIVFAFGHLAFSQQLPEDLKLKAHITRLDAAHANAIFKSDFAALDSLTDDGLTVNHPRGGIVNGKKELFDLIRQGTIKYTSFERTPERFLFFTDMVIVMGNETVVPASTAPRAGEKLQRRYSDIWMKHNGKWQLYVRHANNVCQSK